MSSEVVKFEVLCIDQNGKVEFSKEDKFISALAYNEQLWDGQPQKKDNYFLDEAKNVKWYIQQLDTTSLVSDLFSSAFILTVEGDLNSLEPLRLKLLNDLRKIGFNHLRILNDEVSKEIAVKIYPFLNEVENLLRRYVVKFFTTKIGLNWWDITVPNTVKDKAKIRIDNEETFTKSKIINANVELIDFNELGEIICQQKTAFGKIEDIIQRVNQASSLEELKSEIQGNYSKYFKDYFERQYFEKKWKRCFEIRNKVAHNYLFTQKDLDDTLELCKELKIIINNADEKIDKVVFNIAEKESIKIAIEVAEANQSKIHFNEINESKKENNFNGYSEEDHLQIYKSKTITEEEVIKHLKNTEEEYKKFVGLGFFVKNILASLGYAVNTSYTVINILADKGKIELYDVKNPKGDRPTKAIKLSESARE
ncbi:hypothetical protein C7H19_19030 [Aphanothece hegewaldii CCALA 016]|uniref:Uncharacterized protein n=1 Tax=Aphanothece hegewaldii CCALA 016 TaxID=2107694 RepID=A0A2T1LTH3_9CHRO|nr:Swt1 family HEPN domain-containing protein [Aphanothece hegewaldii]PSF34224.1 hypothetical protein C7H19_19030 [Aphanothece hegewaldii CCALA 016]